MEPNFTSNTRRTTLDPNKPEKATIQSTMNFDQQGKIYNRVSTLIKINSEAKKINAKKFGDSNSSGQMTLNAKYFALTNSPGQMKQNAKKFDDSNSSGQMKLNAKYFALTNSSGSTQY